MIFFSRGHATLELAVSVGYIFDFRGFPLLPTRPRLRGSVYGLVSFRSYLSTIKKGRFKYSQEHISIAREKPTGVENMAEAF